MIPDQFCDEAGLPRGTSAIDFVEGLRASTVDPLDGLLGSDEGKTAAVASLAQIGNYEVRVVRQASVPQEKFCKIHIEGEATPVQVALLAGCDAASFPTDMENLILWGILQPLSLIGTSWIDGVNGRRVDWRRRAKGMAVVALPLPVRNAVVHTVAGLLGLEDGGLGSSPALSPVCAAATELHVAAPTRAFSAVQARLFFESVTANTPKWRFLSFYRLLENAYLSNIKSVLLQEFDKDAARAVDDARKKLASEVNQLVDLMTEGRMEAEFEAFNQEFDTLIAGGNQYITALDRGAQSEALYRQEVAKKAVLRFYKMRCSIAHAGTSSVIFEQMSDSVPATTALLPAVEAIALKSLAVTIR